MKLTLESPEERDQLLAALTDRETTLRTVINRAGRHALPATIAAWETTGALRRRWFPAKEKERSP